MILDREFYRQDATTVARALLGTILVRRVTGGIIQGRIAQFRGEDAAQPADVGSAGSRLRLLHLRHVLAAERGLRAG
jgi:3-methyladenine DNA glycosylase Mpg